MSVDSPPVHVVGRHPVARRIAPESSLSCAQESFTVAGATTTVLFLAGEIDMHTGALADDALRRLVEHPGAYVIVDLTDVRFCGISGFGALVEAGRSITAAGQWFALVSPSARITKVWALLWPDHSITRHPTVTAALTAVRRRQRDRERMTPATTTHPERRSGKPVRAWPAPKPTGSTCGRRPLV